jgi:mono/diheme cytochrome c family protein
MQQKLEVREMSGGYLRTFLFVAAGLVVVFVVVTGLVVESGLYNVAADAPRNPAIARFVELVRERSIEARLGSIDVPPLNRPEMIADGASDYDEMCTGCHLAPGLGENEMRPGLNPKPPFLARGAPGDPKEQFWIIKHGIEMTAMPAWGQTHSDEEIWNIVAFLQHLPGLSPQAYRTLVAKSGDHHHHEMGEAGHMKM